MIVGSDIYIVFVSVNCSLNLFGLVQDTVYVYLSKGIMPPVLLSIRGFFVNKFVISTSVEDKIHSMFLTSRNLAFERCVVRYVPIN